MAIRGSHLDLQRAYEPARLFNGTTEHLAAPVVPSSAPPITIAAWFVTHTAANRSILAWGNSASTNEYLYLYVDSDDKLHLNCKTTAEGLEEAATTINYSVNTLHFGCAVIASSTDRKVWLDDAGVGTNVADLTPATDTFRIGVLKRTTHVFFWDGSLAWVTVWAAALSAGERAALSNRQHFTPPWEIRPESIIAMPNMRTLWDPYLKVRWTPTGTVPANPPWIWRPRHVSMYVSAAPGLDYLPIPVPESRPIPEPIEVVSY